MSEELFTRRQFLKWAVGTATSLTLAGCPQPQVNMTETLPQGSMEVRGEFSGDYSKIVKENDLIPRVFRTEETPRERVTAGIDYLRRFREALANHPELHGNTLSGLKINDVSNIPIDIANTDTVFTIIDRFINDFDSGAIDIVHDSGFNAVLGWDADIVFDNTSGRWIRKNAAIYAGSRINEMGTYQEPDQAHHYSGRTDVENAITLVHEYTHALQQEAVLNQANQNPSSQESRQLVVDWKNRSPRWNRTVQDNVIAVENVSDQHEVELLQRVNFIEVQAFSGAYQFLHMLNRVNGSEHFPGTRRMDLTGQYNLNNERQRFPNSYIQNLYQLYENRVVQHQNSLDIQWAFGVNGIKYP